MGRAGGRERDVIHPRNTGQLVTESLTGGRYIVTRNTWRLPPRKLRLLRFPGMVSGEVVQNNGRLLRLRWSEEINQEADAAIRCDTRSTKVSLKMIARVRLYGNELPHALKTKVLQPR